MEAYLPVFGFLSGHLEAGIVYSCYFVASDLVLQINPSVNLLVNYVIL
jgi:hypothetical protein